MTKTEKFVIECVDTDVLNHGTATLDGWTAHAEWADAIEAAEGYDALRAFLSDHDSLEWADAWDAEIKKRELS